MTPVVPAEDTRHVDGPRRVEPYDQTICHSDRRTLAYSSAMILGVLAALLIRALACGGLQNQPRQVMGDLAEP